MDMDFAPLDMNNDTASKSKKVTYKKNITPITLKMLKKIGILDNKKMLDLVQIERVILTVRVLSLNMMPGRITLSITDGTEFGRIVIIVNAIDQRPEFNQQTQYYKFVCYLKQDLDQLVLYSIFHEKVKNFNQITNHHTKAIESHIQRVFSLDYNKVIDNQQAQH